MDRFEQGDEGGREESELARRTAFAVDRRIADLGDKRAVVREIIGEIPPILSRMDEATQARVMQMLSECAEEQDEASFRTRLLAALDPLVVWGEKNPAIFEKIDREQFIEQNKFVPLNDLLSYGVEPDSVHIHVAPGKTFSTADKLGFMRDGLEKLAQIVKADPAIKEITATSWIVAEHPNLMKRLGFEVDAPAEKPVFHAGSLRPIAQAHMSREEFLARYVAE